MKGHLIGLWFDFFHTSTNCQSFDHIYLLTTFFSLVCPCLIIDLFPYFFYVWEFFPRSVTYMSILFYSQSYFQILSLLSFVEMHMFYHLSTPTSEGVPCPCPSFISRRGGGTQALNVFLLQTVMRNSGGQLLSKGVCNFKLRTK